MQSSSQQSSTNSAFQSVLLHLQRPINCLTDEDRNTRREGLNTISKQIDKNAADPSLIIRLFTETSLQQYLVKRTLWDKVENNREITLSILGKFNAKVKSETVKGDHIKPFIQELIKRVGSTPFPQTSEDLRLDILKLIEKFLIAYPDTFAGFLSEVSNALSKTLLDPFAEIKHASNSLINTLCKRYKDRIGQHSIALIKSLALNLSHQHSKVRKGTLVTAGELLITHNAGSNFEHIQVNIKASLGDKSGDVRKQAVVCVSKLLKGFGPKYMKMHEASLVSQLIGGLSDESQSVVQEAIKQLQECGAAIRQMEAENDPMKEEESTTAQMQEE